GRDFQRFGESALQRELAIAKGKRLVRGKAKFVDQPCHDRWVIARDDAESIAGLEGEARPLQRQFDMACFLARSAPGQRDILEHGGREGMAPVMDAACRLYWLEPVPGTAGWSSSRRGKQAEHFSDPVCGRFVVVDIAIHPLLQPF